MTPPAFDARGGGHDLERRAGELALAVGAADGRLGGVEVVGLVLRLRGVEVVGRQEVGVVGGRRPHGQDLAVAGVERHHRAGVVPERLACGLLDVGADRQDHVSHHVALDEQVAEAVEVEPDVVAGEVAVVLALDAGRTEREGEVPGDVGEELGGVRGVRALQVEPVVGRHRLGEHDAVGADDVAPGAREVPLDRTGVLRLVLQRLGLEHGQPVHLQEQRDVADRQEHPEVADLLAHRPVALVVAVEVLMPAGRSRRSSGRPPSGRPRARPSRSRCAAAAPAAPSWPAATSRRTRRTGASHP